MTTDSTSGDDSGPGDVRRYREALVRIAEIAAAVTTASDRTATGGTATDSTAGDSGSADADQGCRIRALPRRLRERAADTACAINPVNGPLPTAWGDAAIPDPMALTVSAQRYWGPAPRQFTVSFMESTPADLRARIVTHLNAWNAFCGMSFVETAGTGEVRISRGPGGYWSYLGTDIRLIPADRPTMNLQGFTMTTPQQEYDRVVEHEAGHTLGFPHEHMRRELIARIDPAKAYTYFRATQGWGRRMVDAQVLTALSDNSIFGTAPDQDSIMCYQLPGRITVDGQPIRGGADINASDAAFAARIYPPALRPAPAGEAGEVGGGDDADDWDEADDLLALAY